MSARSRILFLAVWLAVCLPVRQTFGLTVELDQETRVEVPDREGVRQIVVQAGRINDEWLVVALQREDSSGVKQAELAVFRREANHWKLHKSVLIGETVKKFEPITLDSGKGVPEAGFVVYGASGQNQELRVYKLAPTGPLQAYAFASRIEVVALYDPQVRRTFVKLAVRQAGAPDGRAWQVFGWDGDTFAFIQSLSDVSPQNAPLVPTAVRKDGNLTFVLPRVVEQITAVPTQEPPQLPPADYKPVIPKDLDQEPATSENSPKKL